MTKPKVLSTGTSVRSYCASTRRIAASGKLRSWNCAGRLESIRRAGPDSGNPRDRFRLAKCPPDERLPDANGFSRPDHLGFPKLGVEVKLYLGSEHAKNDVEFGNR